MKQKKILILCYYYPPNSVIPAWRPHSWANYFSKLGWETHVVCRFWKGGETTWEDQTKGWPDEYRKVENPAPGLSVHYLPTNPKLKKFLEATNKYSLIRKVVTLLLHMAGIFQVELDTFFSFKKYIRQQFADNYFDHVIVSLPPYNLLRLGYALRPKFRNAVFTADFRDWFDNACLRSDYRPSASTSFLNWLRLRYVARWLTRYDHAVSVCQPIVDLIPASLPLKRSVYTNGFEEDIFADLKRNPNPYFTISSIGTIYKEQPYAIVAKGIIDFWQQNKDESIKIKIIGTRPYNEDFCQLFEKAIPAANLTIKGRVPRSEGLQYVKDSNVVVYPGWVGYKGMVSGKIFEYLGAGTTILVAPSDHDVLEQLLKETGAGVTRETSAEVTQQLQVWYEIWKKEGAIPYGGNIEKILTYSRESQAEKMLADLEKLHNIKVVTKNK